MILPAFVLQTKSLREPMYQIMIKDAGDYRYFKCYEFPLPLGCAPTYLFNM